MEFTRPASATAIQLHFLKETFGLRRRFGTTGETIQIYIDFAELVRSTAFMLRPLPAGRARGGANCSGHRSLIAIDFFGTTLGKAK